MKITSFNPTIVTVDLEATVQLFEALGFEKKHNPIGTSAVGNEYTSYRMTDANGFHVDISTTSAPLKQDFTAIRMNVDNFEEAYDFLIAHGFTSGQNGTVTNTGSAKACMLVSSSGFAINLIPHIKDHE
jgi:predicted lactoylglutathione lyase